jgi:hypothetical protein
MFVVGATTLVGHMSSANGKSKSRRRSEWASRIGARKSNQFVVCIRGTGFDLIVAKTIDLSQIEKQTGWDAFVSLMSPVRTTCIPLRGLFAVGLKRIPNAVCLLRFVPRP